MKVSTPACMAIVVFFAVLIPAAAAAQENPKSEKTWRDEAELSFVQTGGNTDIVTFAGKNTLKYQIAPRWDSSWMIGALYSKNDGLKAAERYYTDLRIDYALTEQTYFYAMTGWSQDKFAGIDNRVYLGPGAGYHILTGEHHFLSAEVGLSYAEEEYTDDTEREFLEGRLFGKYTFKLNAKTQFNQTIEYLHNFNDAQKFYVTAVSDLTTTINGFFSIKLSYEILYANEPVPETFKETDTIFKVSLVVNI